MNNFCTLFDSHYLTRGLALYFSLKEHCEDFHIYIYAFDESSYSYLKSANLDKATILSLNDFEDEELLAIKESRSVAEYCWTCTPSIILHSISEFKLENCTYLDADLYFYSSPEVIFLELGQNSILLTEHRYSKEDNQIQLRGKYCVQFMTFVSDDSGLEALKWWRDRCIEWCFAIYDDGKFGDQLYLDDWLERFNSVYVLQHEGGGIAPWNMENFTFKPSADSVKVINNRTNKKSELIFFHFHHLELLTNNKVILSYYKTNKDLIDLVYKPYIKKLLEIEKSLLSSTKFQLEDLRGQQKAFSLLNFLRKLKYFYKGTLNEFNASKFL